MKIVIAPDKFKGSLTALQVCNAIEKGLRKANRFFDIVSLPLSDGGDGLMEAISFYVGAQKQSSLVQDPLGRDIDAEWLLSLDGKTAFIEMAKASGLQLLQKEEYNPLLTSSYGTGQLVNAAIGKGVSKIILGIGGSATNDGGIGLAAALGYRFLDGDGNELSPIGKSLASIQHIDSSSVSIPGNIQVDVASDVNNPLSGPMGATHMYARQKGADNKMIEILEMGMVNYQTILQKQFHFDIAGVAGAGAAGGMGAGCVVFLKARILKGIDLVISHANLDDYIKNADLVITGEGKLDEQSLHGKLISGVCSLAKKHGKPAIIVCGISELEMDKLSALNNPGVITIFREGMDLKESIDNAAFLLEEAGFSIGKF